MKTLLVEDDLAHARFIRRVVENVVDPQDVFHVADGGPALDFVYGRGNFTDRKAYPRPSLILLDLRMPQVDGFEVLETLKKDERTRDIPIVIFSTSDRSQDVDRCYSSGANAYVNKPLDFNEFSKKVEEICQFWTSTTCLPSEERDC